jgi:hypothetical protein
MRSILKAALCEIGVKGIYELPIGMPMEVFYYNQDLFARAVVDVAARISAGGLDGEGELSRRRVKKVEFPVVRG